MITRAGAVIVFRALIAAAVVSTAAAPASAQNSSTPVGLLDVPYLEQSELLCGGAAAAMVMRYWGATDVHADAFAPLVDRAAGGIPAHRLLAELQRRGWDARSFRGDRPLIQSRLQVRQPVVALIEDRPGAFHYVVVIAWANGRVIYHDPARAPFRVIGEAAFETSWQKSDRWTMLALPPASGARPRPGDADGKSTVVDAGDAACTGLITSGIELVGDGDRAAALEAFALAADLCPASSAPLREAAGVHALERRWPEARRLAQAAVDRDRHDDHAWRILATSAYVLGDVRGALRAWNVVGEPRVDLVTVQGLTRTRHASATALLDVPTDITLSTTRLDAARRRLAELPSADLARVQYQPAAGGRANVEGVVVERPLLPSSPASLALIGVRAAIDRELGVDLSSPAGAGDRLSASWRWWENRPRVALSYAAPSRRGVWRVDVRAERQTYGAAVREVERRRGGSVTLANWSNRLLRWEVGGHLDAWGGTARTGALSAALDQRLASDRVSVRGEVQALGGSFAAVAQSVEVGIRSATRHEGLTWIAGGAVDLVSSRAPLALWSGAGTGQGRRRLLRAHPLLDDGRLTGDVFGRRVYAATVEGRAWLPPIFRLLRIAPAVFVDIARAEERRVPGSAWQADAGAGLRVALPGSGMLRIDVGKGMRDGATALSVGWTR